MSENKTDKTAFWAYLGAGLAILLICLGMGTCGAMWEGHIKIGNQTEQKHDTEIQINGK
jgi:hypothetical protein